jgi:hypothetical protein
MDGSLTASDGRTPLEDFVRDYAEVSGGVWEEIEPQVYDLLLPSGVTATDGGVERPAPNADVALRIAFDPEALPEHPGAQLAGHGTPLVDRLLAEAVQRGRYARLHVIGLNLSPHDLPGRVRKGLTLPAGSRVHVERVRLMNFPQAVYWFQATFVSDQKEQEILTVGMDLHHGRQVRHLEELLAPSRLSETPVLNLPEARSLSLAAAYPLAREQVLRTLASLANTRVREVSEHTERQIARMVRYYADLRQELQEQRERAEARKEDLSRFAGRLEALDREERIRVSELRQKSALRVRLRLLQLLVVQQPKFLLRTGVSVGDFRGELELVWDPLTEGLEPAACPQCHRPTTAWEPTRQGRLLCPACAAAVTLVKSPRR